jgi:hypothetical protein
MSSAQLPAGAVYISSHFPSDGGRDAAFLQPASESLNRLAV